MKITKICENCSQPFQTEKYQVKIGFGRFCSLRCSGFFNGNKNKSSKTTNVKCYFCKQEFYKSPSKQKRSKSGIFFCCKEHKDACQKIGGIIAPKHYGVSAAIYRRTAFSTKDKICESCGYVKIPNILVVHHIDHNRKNNDIKNLAVLCPNCHAEHHYNDRKNKQQVSDSN